LSTEAIIALITLIALEIILGIDNIIFISILADKLPRANRKKLRFWGLGLAMVIRLILLAVISWILKLDQELFRVFDVGISGKGLILMAGGLFLLYKSTKEILEKTETGDKEEMEVKKLTGSFKRLLLEIIMLDLVFSIDSIITAVGMAQELWIMYVAVIVAVTLMLFASGPISRYIIKHPSLKILALCFLMMIGLSLLAEGFHIKIPKGYIYFSMAFSFFVNFVQMKKMGRKF
jgi:predicted tellurium resistance membrane protein TerC